MDIDGKREPQVLAQLDEQEKLIGACCESIEQLTARLEGVLHPNALLEDRDSNKVNESIAPVAHRIRDHNYRLARLSEKVRFIQSNLEV